MDETKRQITKIAREVNRLTIRTMKETGIGSGEFDLIHAVRHNPGASQREIGALVHMDKGAVARRVASLENKGYLIRQPNPSDRRGQMLFATERAETLKQSKTAIETTFYDWLLEELDPADRAAFIRILETLYVRSKAESRSGFPQVTARLREEPT